MDLRERALGALGWKLVGVAGNYGVYTDMEGDVHAGPTDAELIGLLLLELEKPPCLGEFQLDGSLGGTQPVGVTLYKRDTYFGCTYLEALVLAVEAAKEGR